MLDLASQVANAGDAGRILLPVQRVQVPGLLTALLEYGPVKALLPLPIVAAIAWPIWWFFRRTWADLDREAAEHRAVVAAAGTPDTRPMACLLITGLVLTLQEYWGGRPTYDSGVRPLIEAAYAGGQTWLELPKYDELYGYCWWVFARVVGYILVPLPLWKLLYPRDSLLDLGFRWRGFFAHLWIYGLCLAIVVPALLLVARNGDFGTYYPFYKSSSRSWFDFAAWEAIYFLQFLALEIFFRGWVVGALRRSLGSAAIFAMAVPYCMIHYGKPYLETVGAIVAGVVLGSLAMRTRSIYAGFLVHVSVALLMDLVALHQRGALPRRLWPV